MVSQINSPISLSAFFALSVMIASCSNNPSQQAASIIDKLDENAKILSFVPKGDKPHLIVSQRTGDNYTVINHNLADKSSDTIARGIVNAPLAARQGTENNLIVSSEPDAKSDGRVCYVIAFYKKGKPDEEPSRLEITNNDKGIVIYPTSFVIDDDARQITITGVSENNADITDINMTFDFDGKMVSDRSVSIRRPDPEIARRAQQSAGSAMYLWQCEKCGKRVNKSKNPGQDWLSGCWHEWVNLGRVN